MAPIRLDRVDIYELVRILIRQGPQEYRIDYGEHQCVCPRAECQREDCYCGKSRLVLQLPYLKTHILKKLPQGGKAPNVSRVLSDA